MQSYHNISKQTQSKNLVEFLIPADGNCFYTALFIGYLLPAIDNVATFKQRLSQLIGQSLVDKLSKNEVRGLINYFIEGLNVHKLKNNSFKEYISYFKQWVGLKKPWAGKEEIKKVTDHLKIYISVNQDTKNLKVHIPDEIYSPSKPSNQAPETIYIFQTIANNDEIGEIGDSASDLEAKKNSLLTSTQNQHFRLLAPASCIDKLTKKLSNNSNNNKEEEEEEQDGNKYYSSSKRDLSDSDDEDKPVENIEAILRRYDSFAWLIQGDSQCGAAYFNEDALFLATNKEENANADEVFRIIKDYLVDIAQTYNKSSAELNKLYSKDRNEKYIEFMDNTLKKISNVISMIDKNVYLLGNKTYCCNFTRSLFKITFSIMEVFLGKYPMDNMKNVLSQLDFDEKFLNKLDKIKKDLASKIRSNSEKNYKIINKKNNSKRRGKKIKDSQQRPNDIKDNKRGGKKIKDPQQRPNEIKDNMVKIFNDMFSNIGEWLDPHTSDDTQRAFSLKLINILMNKEIHYLRDDAQCHAELQIIQKIIDDNNILNNDGSINVEKLKSSDLPRYVGISKKCCLNCECAVKAINTVLTKHGVDKPIIIRTFNGSRGKFKAVIPSFLEKNNEFKDEFLKIRKCKDLEEAFTESDSFVTPPRQNQRVSGRMASKNQKSETNKVIIKGDIKKSKLQPEESLGMFRVYGTVWNSHSRSKRFPSLISKFIYERLQNLLKNSSAQVETIEKIKLRIRFPENSIDLIQQLKMILQSNTNIKEFTSEIEGVLVIETINTTFVNHLGAAISEAIAGIPTLDYPLSLSLNNNPMEKPLNDASTLRPSDNYNSSSGDESTDESESEYKKKSVPKSKANTSSMKFFKPTEKAKNEPVLPVAQNIIIPNDLNINNSSNVTNMSKCYWLVDTKNSKRSVDNVKEELNDNSFLPNNARDKAPKINFNLFNDKQRAIESIKEQFKKDPKIHFFIFELNLAQVEFIELFPDKKNYAGIKSKIINIEEYSVISGNLKLDNEINFKEENKRIQPRS